ncbi:MAG: MYXO-CTERM domain-containing protein [Halioglobus sp.]|nr:MYXO-CTERM domain-containing protein [Halioglobus sp.]
MDIRQTLAGILATLAMAIYSTAAFATPITYDVHIDLNTPLAAPSLGGDVYSASGTLTGTPATPGFLTCVSGGPCGITSMMYEVLGAGSAVLATIDLAIDDPSDPSGQFSGTAAGGAFGTLDVSALLNFTLDVVANTLADGDFALNPAAAGANLLAFQWGSGNPAALLGSVYLGERVCGGPNDKDSCGTVAVTPQQAVPVPGTLLLLGLSLALLGARRRVT